MSRSLSRRTLRRVKQADRNRVIKARTVDTLDDDLSQRKRIEKLWELSINFFTDNGDIKGDTDGNA